MTALVNTRTSPLVAIIKSVRDTRSCLIRANSIALAVAKAPSQAEREKVKNRAKSANDNTKR